MSGIYLLEPRWAAAGAAAAAIIVILSIRHGVRGESAYTDLWHRALAESSLFERWSRWFPRLSIVMIAIAAVLLGLSLANPVRELEGPRDLMLAIDRSASMTAVESGVSRLDASKQKIQQMFGAARPGDRFGIVSLGRELQIHTALQNDRREWERALAEIEAEPFASDLTKPLSALAGAAAPIVLFTDAAGEKSKVLGNVIENANLQIVTERAGSVVANTGIIELEVSDPFPEDEASVKLTIATTKAAGEMLNCIVERGDLTVASAKVFIPAKGRADVTIPFPRGEGGFHRVRMVESDAFALDQEAFFMIEKPARAPIVYVRPGGGGSIFLESALTALAEEFGVSLAIAKSAADAPRDAVVIQNGGAVEGDPPRGIFFGVTKADASVARRDSKVSEIIRIEPKHFLIEGLFFDLLLAERSAALHSEFNSIVSAACGPVVAVESRGAARRVWCSFQLENSNFTILKAAFPIFMRRAFAWCAKGERDFIPFVRAGADPFAALAGILPKDRRSISRLGKLTFADGRESAVNLLEPRLLDISAGEALSASALPSRPILKESLASIPAACAAAAFLIAFLIESVAWIRSRSRNPAAPFPRFQEG
ncbi:MAG: vWA domain-containing protein [Planctomycetota bacterium]